MKFAEAAFLPPSSDAGLVTWFGKMTLKRHALGNWLRVKTCCKNVLEKYFQKSEKSDTNEIGSVGSTWKDTTINVRKWKVYILPEDHKWME